MSRSIKHAVFFLAVVMTAIIASVPSGRALESTADSSDRSISVTAAIESDVGAGEIARLEDGKKSSTEGCPKLRVNVRGWYNAPVACHATLLTAHAADAAAEIAPYSLQTLEICIQV